VRIETDSSLPSPLVGLGERRELPQRGLGQSPGRKGIGGMLSIAEHLWLKENQVFRETFIMAYTNVCLLLLYIIIISAWPLLEISWLK